MIYPHHLDFMEEAKKAFEQHSRLETYRDEHNTLIALRYGADRNCMQIYELGGHVGFFAEVMEKAPDLIVDVKKEIPERNLPYLDRYEDFKKHADSIFENALVLDGEVEFIISHPDTTAQISISITYQKSNKKE